MTNPAELRDSQARGDASDEGFDDGGHRAFKSLLPLGISVMVLCDQLGDALVKVAQRGRE
jgi:hypothetical protein